MKPRAKWLENSIPNTGDELYGKAETMDRRRRKTRAAIFSALDGLLEEKDYDSITVSNIIDRADVGRTTFYDNFETKDDLLDQLCQSLFDHVAESASAENSRGGEVFDHLLWHLKEDDDRALRMLASRNSEVFARYFTGRLEGLVASRVSPTWLQAAGMPESVAVRLVSSGFVELVRWWSRGGLEQEPKTVTRWFLELYGDALG